VHKEFELENNQIQGVMKIFSPEGIISEELTYENGVQLGTQKKFDLEGRLEKKEIIHFQPRITEISYYYPNGQIQTSFKKDSLGVQSGEVNYWYENGTLNWSYFLDNDGKHTRPYMEYYPTKKIKLEVDRSEEKPRYINFWDEEGNQLLTNGTGLYYNEYQFDNGDSYRVEYHFKNFLEDGVQKGYKNEILQSYMEIKDGKSEGYYRKYYPNGKLKEEYRIKDRQVISHLAKPLFENPKLNVEIETGADEASLLLREYTLSETYPKLLNEEEAREYISIPTEQFEPYGWEEKLWGSYLLHINESGEVKGYDFFSSRNGFVSRAIEAVFPKLKFKPGLKNCKSVPSYLFFKVKLWLEESEQ